MSLKEEMVWSGAIASCEGPVIGIDLGTSNSCVAIWHSEKSRAKIIRNSYNKKITPSTLSFSNSFERISVGVSPDCSAVTEAFKRYIGLTGADITANYSELLPSELATDHEDRLLVQCFSATADGIGSCRRYISAEELSSHLLSYLRAAAEDYLREKPIKGFAADTPIYRAVIGVPANFTHAQREATRRAAERAGLTEVVLMVESTAAALGYGLTCAGAKSVMVFDMGGGTCDITISRIRGDGQCCVDAVAGHGQCGGRDVDSLLLHHVLHSVAACAAASPHSEAIAAEPDNNSSDTSLPALLALCRICKERLSVEEECTIRVPKAVLPSIQALQTELIRSSHLLRSPHESLTWRHHMGTDDVELYSSRGSEETRLSESSASTSSDAEGYILPCVADDMYWTVVVSRESLAGAIGPILAEVAGVVSTAVEMFRLYHEQGQEGEGQRIDEVVLVGGSSRIQCIRRAVATVLSERRVGQFTTEGLKTAGVGSEKEFCVSVDPHECVACGLAVKGALLMGVPPEDLADILMLDALPSAIGVLSSGSEDGGEVDRFFEPVLERGARLPCRCTKRFRVCNAQQTEVSLDVYEELCEGNGNARFVLMGSYDVRIRGAVQNDGADGEYFVDVVMSIDIDGILRIDVSSASTEEGNPITAFSQTSSMLLLYIVFLVALYVALKLLLPSPFSLSGQEQEAGEYLAAGVDEMHPNKQCPESRDLDEFEFR